MDANIFVQLTVIHIFFGLVFYSIFLAGSCWTSMEIKIGTGAGKKRNIFHPTLGHFNCQNSSKKKRLKEKYLDQQLLAGITEKEKRRKTKK